MNSIQRLDENMAEKDATVGLCWFDARQFQIEGRGWTDTERFYARLPLRAQSLLRTELWSLGQHTAGICVLFSTDAQSISARWRLLSSELAMPHMAATGVSGLDLYTRHQGRWRSLGVGKPSAILSSAVLVEGLSPQMREYCLYLPLYNGIEQLELGFPVGSQVAAARRSSDKKPICFYGSSIVQGGCASRPGMSHVAILGRRLDWPTLNLGFSGNAKMEGEVARLLAESDPAAYVLDCLPNLREPLITERAKPFVETLRLARQNTPIVLVENIPYANAYACRDRSERLASSNAALRHVYSELLAGGLENVHYLPSDNLLGSDSEGTVDGGHPTDLGFVRIANAFEPVLRHVLGLQASI